MSNYRQDDWVINIPLYSIGNIEVVKENSNFLKYFSVMARKSLRKLTILLKNKYCLK